MIQEKTNIAQRGQHLLTESLKNITKDKETAASGRYSLFSKTDSDYLRKLFSPMLTEDAKHKKRQSSASDVMNMIKTCNRSDSLLEYGEEKLIKKYSQLLASLKRKNNN